MELKTPKLKFPTTTEMAKEVAEKALDEYVYEGKTIRQWVEILKDYDDKKTTLERIVKRLEETKGKDIVFCPPRANNKTAMLGQTIGLDRAIGIVKEEM